MDKEESKLDLLNGRPRANYRDFGLYGHILREILNASSLLAVAVEVDTGRHVSNNKWKTSLLIGYELRRRRSYPRIGEEY